jgi:GT2 family glycosyltransferase
MGHDTVSPSIAVIVLNYNNAQLTFNCVRSLLKQDYPTYRVLVVDNHSAPADRNMLTAGLPKEVALLTSRWNHGFSSGLNIGFRAAMDVSEIMVAVNNDVIVTDRNTLRCLSAALQRDPDAVAVSPLVQDHRRTDPRLHTQVRRVPDFAALVVAHSPLAALVPRFRELKKWYTYGDVRPWPAARDIACETINGSCFAIRSDFLGAIGCLDEGTFLYMEEIILGAQIKRCRKHALLCTRTTVDHAQGATTGMTYERFSLRRYCQQVRSELYYARRYLGIGLFGLALMTAVRSVDAGVRAVSAARVRFSLHGGRQCNS